MTEAIAGRRIATRLRQQRTSLRDAVVDAEDDGADNDGADSSYEEPSRKRRKASKRRVISDNIDDHDDFEENGILKALSTPEVDVSEIASDWLDGFMSHDDRQKQESVKELVNFVLRSCGCVSLVKRHDVVDAEKADETVREVQELFLRQEYHEFPLYMSSPASREFKERAFEFVNQLLVLASGNGLLYADDEEFIDTLLAWIGSMSTSNEPSLRLAATLYSLQMETTLCKLSAAATKFIDRSERQIKAERKKLKAASGKSTGSTGRVTRGGSTAEIKKRIDDIEALVEYYRDQKKKLDKLATERLFSVFFTHRYRDVDPLIRSECIKALGVWMKEYPEVFLKAVYLRYFGWLLTDQDPEVRRETLKSLEGVYQHPLTLSALRQFSSHFKGIVEHMLAADQDTQQRVKPHAAAVLTQMASHGFLSEDELSQIGSHILDAKATEATRRELARFVSTVEVDKYREVMERSGEAFKDGNLSKFLKFKLLFEVLADASFSDNDSAFSALAAAAKNLFSLVRYNDHGNSIEEIVDYLLTDSSDLGDNISKNQLKLSAREQEVALAMVATIGEILQTQENYKKAVGKRASEDDRAHHISYLITKLPELIALFGKTTEMLPQLLDIAASLLPTDSTSEGLFDEANQLPIAHQTVSSLLKALVNAPATMKSLGAPHDKFLLGLKNSGDEYLTETEEYLSTVLKNLEKAIAENSKNLLDSLSKFLKVTEFHSQQQPGAASETIGPVLKKLCAFFEKHPERLQEEATDWDGGNVATRFFQLCQAWLLDGLDSIVSRQELDHVTATIRKLGGSEDSDLIASVYLAQWLALLKAAENRTDYSVDPLTFEQEEHLLSFLDQENPHVARLASAISFLHDYNLVSNDAEEKAKQNVVPTFKQDYETIRNA